MLLDKGSLAVRKVASKEAGRINLHGIRVEADGTTVATDGHVLAIVKPCDIPAASHPLAKPCEDALKPFVLGADSADKVDKAIRAAAKGNSLPVLGTAFIDVAATNANGHAELAVTDIYSCAQSMKPQKMDVEFPDYSQIMPSKPVAFRVGLNAHYLRALADIAEACGDRGKSEAGRVVLEFFAEADGELMPPAKKDGENRCYASAIRVTDPKAPRFSALLMPVRC